MDFIVFVQKNIFLFALAIAVFVALVTLEVRSFNTRGADLSPAGLSQSVNRGSLLVDLRLHDDYRKGHIAGAKNIPFEELMGHLNTFEGKEAEIIFYCYSSGLSSKAISKLRKEGYENVKHLKGGIDAWNAENLPVAKKG